MMISRAFATLSLTLLAAATASAQGSAWMRADIPFEFRVGAAVLPAGQYHVTATNSLVTIRCIECDVDAAIMTGAVEGSRIPESGKLVFRRYGNTYFLSTVWVPDRAQGRQLQKSRTEREFARAGRATTIEVAAAHR